MMRRNWGPGRLKIELEGRCRACENTHRIETAHITRREADRYPPVGWDEDRDGRWGEPYKVVPTRVIPLCGPSTDPTTCHGADHNRRLDTLSLLTLEEQVQAVADAGGVEAMRIRTNPSAYPERLAGRIEHRLSREQAA